MPTIVQLKRTETAGAIPAANEIAVGELAINLADGALYSKRTDGAIIEIGGYNPDLFVMPAVMDMGDLAGVSPDTYDMGTL